MDLTGFLLGKYSDAASETAGCLVGVAAQATIDKVDDIIDAKLGKLFDTEFGKKVITAKGIYLGNTTIGNAVTSATGNPIKGMATDCLVTGVVKTYIAGSSEPEVGIDTTAEPVDPDAPIDPSNPPKPTITDNLFRPAKNVLAGFGKAGSNDTTRQTVELIRIGNDIALGR